MFISVKAGALHPEYSMGIKGENLADDVRNQASFKKDEV